MARQITEREETGVRLLTIEVSEDELELFVASLNHILDHCDDKTLELTCGAYRDEIEGIRDDLAQLLAVPQSESVETPLVQPAATG
jgi:hypothetical protein